MIMADCTCSCKSREHYNTMIGTLSKCQDGDTIKFICLTLCKNFWRLEGDDGSSILHWTSALGLPDLTDWILGEFGAQMHIKDFESLYTPLHKALLYGQITCAQVLIDHGASLSVQDAEGMTPLQLIHSDLNSQQLLLSKGDCDVLTCGLNETFSLGHALPTPRRNPEPVDFFCRQDIRIKQVCMSKFHTLFVGSDGCVFSCGHGLGGRLGLGHEKTQFKPHSIHLPNSCSQVAVGYDHSLFLLENGQMFGCGSNRYGQLGQGETSAMPFISPIRIQKGGIKDLHIVCIGAAGYHSALSTADNSVFTFGLNGGQLGHIQKMFTVDSPKQVTEIRPPNVKSDSLREYKNVVHIACSVGAVVVTTNSADGVLMIHLLNNYTHKRMRINTFEADCPTVYGGCLVKFDGSKVEGEGQSDHVDIVLRAGGGFVYHWYSEWTEIRRIIFDGSLAPSRMLFPTFVCLRRKQVTVLTPEGCALSGTLKRCNSHSDKKVSKEVLSVPGRGGIGCPVQWLNPTQCSVVQLNERTIGIHKAVSIAGDPMGKSYAFIQKSPLCDLTDIPEIQASTMREELDQLLQTTHCRTPVHDIMFKTDYNQYHLHKFILCSQGVDSSAFDAEDDTVNLGDCGDDLIMAQFLKFIYTETCELTNVGTYWSAQSGVIDSQNITEIKLAAGSNKAQASQKSKFKGTAKNVGQRNMPLSPLASLKRLANVLHVKQLQKRLSCLTLEWVEIEQSPNLVGKICRIADKNVHAAPIPRFKMHVFENLLDATLHCLDGVSFKAHRCILSARCDFFRSMFEIGWLESNNEQPLNVPLHSDVFETMLFYFYSDDLPPAAKKLGSNSARGQVPEHLCNLLAAADVMLCERLRQICESTLAMHISLQNVSDMLTFCDTYNASELKSACLQFICLNLAALLDVNAFRNLSRNCLDDITKAYRKQVRSVEHRVVTPMTTGLSREHIDELDTLMKDGTINLQVLTDNAKQTIDTDTAHKTKQRVPYRCKLGKIRKMSISSPPPVECKGNTAQFKTEFNPKLTELTAVEDKTTSEASNEKADHVLHEFHADVDPLQSYFVKQKLKTSQTNDTAWGAVSSECPGGPSLRQVILMEEKRHDHSVKLEKYKVQKAMATSSGPVSPKSWAQATNATNIPVSSDQFPSLGSSPPPPIASLTNFQQILEEEKEEQSQRIRIESKSLEAIQIEESAISQLLYQYAACTNYDQFITVTRQQKNAAAPIWKGKAKT